MVWRFMFGGEKAMSEKWDAQEGEVVAIDGEGNPEVILVASDSSDEPYTVRRAVLRIENEETEEESFIRKWACSCKAYEYGEGKPCKHIKRAIPEDQIPDISMLTGNG